jgi:hypothetical protein
MRLFWVLVALCALGLAASAPFLLQALSALPLPPGVSVGTVFAAQAAQTLVLSALAAFTGTRLAARAGLDAPWLRAWAGRSPLPPGFARVAIEGAALGSLAAVALAGILLPIRPSLPAALSRAPQAGFCTAATSAFYGGIVEEVITRWGLLSAAIALARKLGARDGFWAANPVAAGAFGLLHLPVLAAVAGPLTGALVAYALLANGVPGLLFGWLCRRNGLESAMIAHAAADVWLHAALPALLA